MKIELTDDAVPFAVRTPRTIPFCWREEVREQFNDLVQKGVIEPVCHPTHWCHPLVPVPKTSEGRLSLRTSSSRRLREAQQVRQETCSSREEHTRRSRIDRDRSQVLHETGREGWVPPDTYTSEKIMSQDFTTCISPGGGGSASASRELLWVLCPQGTFTTSEATKLWAAYHAPVRSWTTSSSGTPATMSICGTYETLSSSATTVGSP